MSDNAHYVNKAIPSLFIAAPPPHDSVTEHVPPLTNSYGENVKRRSLLAAPVACALMVALTSCSPAVIGTLGIARQDDGSLTVMIRICEESVDSIALRAINSYPVPENDEPDDGRWANVRDELAPLPTTVIDSVDIPLPFEESSVRSDILYELMAHGQNGTAHSAYFSAADLEALEPGFVLTPAMRESIDPVLTPPEFESRAREACS